MPALLFKFLRQPIALLAWGVSLAICVAAQQLPLKNYTTSEGLPHNTVNRIVKDSRGFLWFCTDDGLARFDGYTFTNYNIEQGLPHRAINDFLETRTGEYWLATNGGLVRFNPQGVPMARVVNTNETMTPAPMFTVVLPIDTDRNARAMTKLLESHDGTLWCGTLKYLYRLERHGGRFELVPSEMGRDGKAPKQVHTLDLLEDRQGSLWVASFSGLFRRRPDGGIEQYTKHEGLPDNNIHDLLEDARGQLWVSTRLNGFFRFAVNAQHARSVVAEAYNQQNGLPTNWIFQLHQTTDHRFWVATNKGLIEFFPEAAPARRFRTYTRRNGLSHQEISTLGEDAGENLWLGTQTTGTMKLVRSGFVSYGEPDGLIAVNAIFEDATGRVCFRGSVLGDQRHSAFDGAKLDLQRAGVDEFYPRLGCFDGQRFDWFMPKVIFDFGWVYEQNVVRTREGEWWVGTGAGLYRFPASDNFTSLKTARPLVIYATKEGLASQQVFRVFADSGGNVWVSAFGLARWERASQTMHDLAGAPNLPALNTTLVRSFAEDQAGNIWIGFNTGVARYRAGQFVFFSTNKELPLGGIMDILADRAGRLWLASSRSGLIYLDDSTAEQPVFKRYTTAQGLSSNSTTVLTEDDYGRIYVATGRGLDQLDPATGRLKHYTTADGLAPGNVIAAFRDHSGALWFGTHRGLSRFVPEAIKTTPPPPILITALNVAGERRAVSAFGETNIALTDLASDRNQLQIDFVALGFASGEVLRYQYQLEGSDTDWSPLSAQRTVNYASLAPGRYRFLVRAVNADGIASATPATISFTILRPIWQRWWFLALIAALTGLTGVALYRYRVARLLELERMRTRIATDLHDDIGAGLSRVAILSEVVKRQVAGSNEQSLPLLTEIADSARALVESMREIVWAIDPRRDELGNLVARVRQFASDVLDAQNINWEFDAPPELEELKLDPEQRRHLFLIFKEALNNIAKHADCQSVSLRLRQQQQQLLGEIRDDGRGFLVSSETLAESNSTNGHGLENIKRRAAQLGGRVEIEALPGAGVSIKIMLPLKKR
jgi:ligand-binding sensor domain-containing protein/signal transduction histidine kinase